MRRLTLGLSFVLLGGCSAPGLAVGVDGLDPTSHHSIDDELPCDRWLWVSFPPVGGRSRLKDMILGLDHAVTGASVVPVEGEDQVWRITWNCGEAPVGTLFLSTRRDGFDDPDLLDPARPDPEGGRFGVGVATFARRTRDHGGGIDLLLRLDGSYGTIEGALAACGLWGVHDVVEPGGRGR